jgi:hypothetical protein
MNIITVVTVAIVFMNIVIIKVRKKRSASLTCDHLLCSFHPNAGYVISVSVLNAKLCKLLCCS